MDIVADIAAGLEGTNTPHEVIVDRAAAIEWAIEHHRAGGRDRPCRQGA